MRGHQRYLDQDAGRPDLGILRAHQLGRDRRSCLCAGSRQVVSARIRASSDGQIRGGGWGVPQVAEKSELLSQQAC